MNIIEANIVDVTEKKIFPARIFFDTHIQQIDPLPDVVDGSFLLPGLVDAHVHIESSMLPPSEFARMAICHGTLAAIADPHEITNVLGIAGIDYMVEDAARFPFRFVFGAPSCVPATPFESTGICITYDDIDNLFKAGKVHFLSEVMNFPGVISGDAELLAKITVARKYGKPVDGHAPGVSGEELLKYAGAGKAEPFAVISTDHECSALSEAEEKIRSGMKILIREGSAAKNFDALSPLIDRYPDMVMLCTDDCHPDDLMNGHINRLLAKGIDAGLDLFSLLRAATLNPVRHYQVDLGLLRTGDSADFIVTDDLKTFSVQKSFLRGVCLYDRVGNEQEKISLQKSGTFFSERFCARRISKPDVAVTATSDTMKVIQAIDGDLRTKQFFHKVTLGQAVNANVEADILKLVVVNRYCPEKPAVAFIRGFGLKQGALASSIAHDSHHIVAIGCDDESLLEVINDTIDIKGGITAYYENKLIALKLDIAGLMSSASGEEVAKAYQRLNHTAARMGSTLKAPFMTLSFMALLVIPELKLGEKGLFDVHSFEWTNLFVE